MTAADLSSLQLVILGHIRLHWVEKGYAPTVRELATKCSMAISTMHYHLDRLQTKGYVEWTPYTARTLRVPPVGASL